MQMPASDYIDFDKCYKYHFPCHFDSSDSDSDNLETDYVAIFNRNKPPPLDISSPKFAAQIVPDDSKYKSKNEGRKLETKSIINKWDNTQKNQLLMDRLRIKDNEKKQNIKSLILNKTSDYNEKEIDSNLHISNEMTSSKETMNHSDNLKDTLSPAEISEINDNAGFVIVKNKKKKKSGFVISKPILATELNKDELVKTTPIHNVDKRSFITVTNKKKKNKCHSNLIKLDFLNENLNMDSCSDVLTNRQEQSNVLMKNGENMSSTSKANIGCSDRLIKNLSKDFSKNCEMFSQKCDKTISSSIDYTMIQNCNNSIEAYIENRLHMDNKDDDEDNGFITVMRKKRKKKRALNGSNLHFIEENVNLDDNSDIFLDEKSDFINNYKKTNKVKSTGVPNTFTVEESKTAFIDKTYIEDDGGFITVINKKQKKKGVTLHYIPESVETTTSKSIDFNKITQKDMQNSKIKPFKSKNKKVKKKITTGNVNLNQTPISDQLYKNNKGCILDDWSVNVDINNKDCILDDWTGNYVDINNKGCAIDDWTRNYVDLNNKGFVIDDWTRNYVDINNKGCVIDDWSLNYVDINNKDCILDDWTRNYVAINNKDYISDDWTGNYVDINNKDCVLDDWSLNYVDINNKDCLIDDWTINYVDINSISHKQCGNSETIEINENNSFIEVKNRKKKKLGLQYKQKNGMQSKSTKLINWLNEDCVDNISNSQVINCSNSELIISKNQIKSKKKQSSKQKIIKEETKKNLNFDTSHKTYENIKYSEDTILTPSNTTINSDDGFIIVTNKKKKQSVNISSKDINTDLNSHRSRDFSIGDFLQKPQNAKLKIKSKPTKNRSNNKNIIQNRKKQIEESNQNTSYERCSGHEWSCHAHKLLSSNDDDGFITVSTKKNRRISKHN